jgi:hypothetical protein
LDQATAAVESMTVNTEGEGQVAWQGCK